MYDEKNGCWPFILALYEQPGVPETCLRLQDECGADVPLFLFLVWLAGVRHVAVDETDLAALQAFVGPWQRDTVTPLRTVRRALRSSELMQRPVVVAFREGLKRQELEGERTEILLLEEWAQQGGRPVENLTPDHNVALYLAALPRRDVPIAPILAACAAVLATPPG